MIALLAIFQDRPGYDDTPVLPGQTWRVHDKTRPDPASVKTDGAPSDAVVLFDGSNLDQWKGGKWRIVDGAMEVSGGDLETVDSFGDCQLHVEWRTPEAGKGDGQARGNSGVFLMGRYEIQVLDSFESPSYADGSAGAIYGQYPPLVNASRKSGQWQSYDVLFTAPRFKDDKLETPAYVTVLHNGVVIHNHTAILGQTVHRAAPKYEPHGPTGPIRLQDHGDPIRYRNIWVRPLKGYDEK